MIIVAVGFLEFEFFGGGGGENNWESLKRDGRALQKKLQFGRGLLYRLLSAGLLRNVLQLPSSSKWEGPRVFNYARAKDMKSRQNSIKGGHRICTRAYV